MRRMRYVRHMCNLEFSIWKFQSCGMYCLQSVVDSNIVEVSEDKTLVRCKSEPDKWPLVNFPIGSSTLNAEVPEFVPGQKYAAPAKGEHCLTL